MKKLILIGLLGLATLAYSFTGSYDRVRVAGTDNVVGNKFYQLVDSSDTFKVDTFYSDTIDIGDHKWINFAATVVSVTEADSCNDSIPIMIKAYGVYDVDGIKQTLLTDSLNATAGSQSTGTQFLWIFRVDTVGCNKMYFETVISDSFIAGAGEDDNTDTSIFDIKYEVTQTGSR